MNLSRAMKVDRVENAAAAATTDLESDAVDMAGFEGCIFYFLFGTITAGAVTNCHLEQSSDSGVADGWSDIADSGVTVNDDDDNQVAVIDILRPTKRYIRAVIDRGTQNAVVDGIIAAQYGARKLPTTDDTATVIERVVLASPSEGTI